MSKITLEDTVVNLVVKMSERNPGAMATLMEMVKSDKIDPDNIMGGMGNILLLDSLGIYGTDIYVLYNDICDRKMSRMFAMIRAWQLGFLKGNILKEACSKQDYSGCKLIPVEELYAKVKKELPNFDR